MIRASIKPYQFGILHALAEYVFMSSEMFGEVLGPVESNGKGDSPIRLLNYYLLQLVDDFKYIGCVQPNNFSPKAYFLKRAGADYLYDLTGVRYRYSDIQSTQNFLHDLEATRQHIILKAALTNAGMEIIRFERHRGLLQDWADKKRTLSINPDYVPIFRNPQKAEKQITVCYGDPQKGRSRSENGTPENIGKIAAYQEYYESGKFADTVEERFGVRPDLMRVYFTFERDEKAVNFAKECGVRGFTYRRYRFASHEALHSDPLGKIWVTPKDFRAGAKYGYLD